MKRFVLIITIFISILLLLYVSLWMGSRKSYPVVFGVSFSKNHATWLGLDWKKTYHDILTDLHPQYIRFAALWSDTEPDKGKYDFRDLDYMMNAAADSNTKVALVIGQKVPRWPECYIPAWAKADKEQYKEQLMAYIKKTVQRYRSHDALDVWQVENEPYIHFSFGACDGYDSTLVAEEIQLAKSLDAKHDVMVTDSGELGWWTQAGHAGDIFGTTIYRIVTMPSGRYVSYSWLPAGWYVLRAHVLGIPYERFWVSELQAEPWIPGSDPRKVTVEEMEKSMSPAKMQENITYAQHTGVSRAYLWGVEWWYWMKQEKNDARYWNIAKNLFEKQPDALKI